MSVQSDAGDTTVDNLFMHHAGTNWQLNTEALSTSSTAIHIEPAT